ncbi:glycoside hydrolase family 2 TIM barrel-domain containing protein [Gorillibacterium sp. CAU 1737]|uniref:glycoside hydrolase family 2 TIM barrel-domain containing protein n=1 Tax=Gorillibacterium sp. CAU 1737 TaxID=3140362 RepID=UPI003261231E
MDKAISLAGTWKLRLSPQEETVSALPIEFDDSMELPGTTSHARKGKKNETIEIGTFTDEYLFEGSAWFAKEIEMADEWADRPIALYLERTRVTTLYVDGQEIGTENSLNTPHLYNLTGVLTPGKHELVIRVDNVNYPTRGGHLTSKDTQTNWNGITGRIELQVYGSAYLEDVQLYPDVADRSVRVKAKLNGDGSADRLVVSARSEREGVLHTTEAAVHPLTGNVQTELELVYPLGDDALLWGEYEPNLYELKLELVDSNGALIDTSRHTFGLREFLAVGDKFHINGVETFLRGKHDGLVFPLTGYAPTTVEEWENVLGIAKEYGMNHYRFHTCCPPEAAFTAADRLGIYMEPELPFWGTMTDETYEQHNAAEQEYLIQEGFAMMRTFGNHPSFVMMSLGNELWGSKTRIDEVLKAYKEVDDRHLYTQGSNNFQFVPDVLEHEDFFCGVRFSRDRLIRGSYAMCDAPLGHIQTDRPGTRKDYDEAIQPMVVEAAQAEGTGEEATIQIQYGTEARTVKAADRSGELIPRVPVVSHEIGQYATFPNFAEIEKYTGSIKAKNFEVFRQRLVDKGLDHLAEKYFHASGQLAVACYQEEMEAAFRSRNLAGFQILDLQDFPGQGTALVGLLDAFMDSKGLITPEEWRQYCSDAVLLARFDKYIYEAGEPFAADVELSYYRPQSLKNATVKWELTSGQATWAAGELPIPEGTTSPRFTLGSFDTFLPTVASMTKGCLSLQIVGTDIRKAYDLWVIPQQETLLDPAQLVFQSLSQEVEERLANGESVLLFPEPEQVKQGIEGTYCTDFWNYPMFRSISESMNRPVPVGTMGLLINKEHPALVDFPSEVHSTYPWWSIVQHSRSLILDELPKGLFPIVQTIDNFERNHKLGLLVECKVGAGRLLICPIDVKKVAETLEGSQFLRSLIHYVQSEQFNPDVEVSLDELRALLH